MRRLGLFVPLALVLTIELVSAAVVISTERTLSTTLDRPRSVFPADLDKDGDIDIVSCAYGQVVWFENLGSKTFSTAKVLGTPADVRRVYAADLDADGDIDILSASFASNTIGWFENYGNKTFSAIKVISSAALGANSVFAIDLDGDGDIDVLSTSATDNKVAWYENMGSKTFSVAKLITTAVIQPNSVFAIDLDGDGDADVLSTSFGDNRVCWYENYGNKTFSVAKIISSSATGAVSVFAIDLDRDGDMDVLSASQTDHKVAWYENYGNKTFSTAKTISTAMNTTTSVYAADIDNDGDVDVLSSSQLDNKLAWYENYGNKTFSTPKIISTTAMGAFQVVTADVDGDGDSDVIAALLSGNKTSWYESQCSGSCNDGNACTLTDTCVGGTCVGSNPVVCTALDQCHTAGVCSTTTGMCSNPIKSNSSPCTDGNACTNNDTCQAGVCLAGAATVCTPLDQCHLAGVCNTASGLCSNPNKNNGVSCNDNNACTSNDACQTGVCIGVSSVVCGALDQCHVAGVCNTTTGVCSNPNKANSIACNDNNACTLSDACQNGVCVGSAKVCSALDQCHAAGVCNTVTGICTQPVKANNTVCNDQNSCTLTDVCVSGVCVGSNLKVCPTPDQCHLPGTCNPSTGVCSNPNKNDSTPCTDASFCTQQDVCMAGVCVGTAPIICQALDQCHNAGVCNAATGVCTNPNKANASPCNDGNACTRTDKCQAGICVGANPVVCPVPDQCHLPGTCNTLTGVCSNPNKNNTSPCNDNNLCTRTDTCFAGGCYGGDSVTCPEPDQCHLPGVCNPTTGVCSNPIKNDSTPCNDGNACTQSDTCQAGVCVGADPVVCPLSDQCHLPAVCSPATGSCSHFNKNDRTPCNDANACTQKDMCQSGVCVGTDPVICSEPEMCYAPGKCNTRTGICSTPIAPDGTPCSDEDTRTANDSCHSGVCAGYHPACPPPGFCRIQPNYPPSPAAVPLPPPPLPPPPDPEAYYAAAPPIQPPIPPLDAPPEAPTPSTPPTNPPPPPSKEPSSEAVSSTGTAGSSANNETTVQATLRLQGWTLASLDTADKRVNFESTFIRDVSTALEIEPSRVKISALTAGSIVVHFDILDNRTPSSASLTLLQLANKLEGLVQDHHSALYTGEVTNSTDPNAFYVVLSTPHGVEAVTEVPVPASVSTTPVTTTLPTIQVSTSEGVKDVQTTITVIAEPSLTATARPPTPPLVPERASYGNVPFSAAHTHTPATPRNFDQERAEAATQVSQLNSHIDELKQQLNILTDQQKLLHRRDPVPTWALGDGACPDRWTRLQYHSVEKRVYCSPPENVNYGPANSACRFTAKFPELYDRCGWSLRCGAVWTSYKCHHQPGTSTAFPIPDGVPASQSQLSQLANAAADQLSNADEQSGSIIFTSPSSHGSVEGLKTNAQLTSARQLRDEILHKTGRTTDHLLTPLPASNTHR